MEQPATDTVLGQVSVPALELRVLGPFEAAGAGDVLDLGSPKQRAVLALLALRAPMGISVDGVIDGLWGEGAPEAARASVYSYVSNLKAQLGGGIDRLRGSYVLAIPFDSDASAFERAVDGAHDILPVDPDRAARILWDALSTWRGLPYADLVDIPGLEREGRRLEELRLFAVEMRFDAELASGRGLEVVPELRALVAEHPLRERLRAQLMLALYRSGRQAEALREYGHLRELLVSELGVDPSPELQELEVRILQQDGDLSAGTGAVTTQRLAFLFTDIEGSTRLWNEQRGAMADALARHDELLRAAVDEKGGIVFKHTGDGALAVFPHVEGAAAAAERAQRVLQESDWGRLGDLRVRMAIDVGDVDVRDGDYFGPPLNRCARILSATHGGQVALSSSAFDDLSSGHIPGMQIRQLGTHRLRGLGAPERLAQLVFVGLPAEFPDLVTDAEVTDLGERLEAGGLPGYELRERLGKGVWGSVYRAYQPAVGREVAVRVISSDLANHPSFVRRFEAHARTVAQLEHPHIVPLYDFWRDHGGAYLVMQLMRGGSLGRAMREEPWDPVAVVGLLRQVGSALSYAHGEGAVHGDIRPANVLLDGRGNAYVSDFGLAADFVDSLGLHLRPNRNSAYLAPEVRSDEALDPRADVYSLAVLAFALLSGREPPASGPLPRPSLAGVDAEALDAVLLRGSASDRDERFEDIAGFIEAVEEACDIGVLADHPPVRTGLRNPFKGLRPFFEGDAGDFHGRSELVETLVDAVGDHRLVAVVGPSGSGKSSAVQAGLVPRLRAGGVAGSDEWFFASFTPGPHPVGALVDAVRSLATSPLGDVEGRLLQADLSLRSMAEGLLPAGSAELVLVVDQFEELFTLSLDEEERAHFIELLAGAVEEGSRVRVVLTLRADFYDRPLGHPCLATLVSEGLVTVLPPTVDDLIAAIERPALAVGMTLEPGLPTRIAGDVLGQPGGLPLLQYALTEMVERRATDMLSGTDYEAIGTVRGAVARRAEAVFSSLDEGEQAAARNILLRLVTVDEESDDTRRRVKLGELEGLGHHPRAVARVLDAFGTSRLLSFDRDPVSRAPTVEVAHEALLREWGRLRGWIEGEREALILARRLRINMSQWEESGFNDDYLLAGDRLSPFRHWTNSGSLTRDERAFLERSAAADEAARATRRRRRRVGIASLATAAVVATVLAVLAVAQGQRADWEATRAVALAEQEAAARGEAVAQQVLADQERRRAEEQAALAEDAAGEAIQAGTLARARELAASAIGVGEDDPQLAMLLALEAFEVAPAGEKAPPEVLTALRRALHANRLVRIIEVDPIDRTDAEYSKFVFVTTIGDGSRIVVEADAGPELFSTETWEKVPWAFDWPDALDLVAVSRDGSFMLLRTDPEDPDDPRTDLLVVGLEDGETRYSFSVDCHVDGADWSPEGDLLAVIMYACGVDGRHLVEVYDTVTWTSLAQFEISTAIAVHFAGDLGARRLVIVDWQFEPGTRFIDADTLEVEATLDAGAGAMSPDGKTLLGLSILGPTPMLYEVETGRAIDRLQGIEGWVALGGAFFSPDGSLVTTLTEGSKIPIWDVETGELAMSIPAGPVLSATFDGSGDYLITGVLDGTVKVWDLSVAATGEARSGDLGGPAQSLGIQAGETLGVVAYYGEEHPSGWTFDPTTGVLGVPFPEGSAEWTAAAGDSAFYLQSSGSKDGRGEGPLQRWNPETGEIQEVWGCWRPMGALACEDGREIGLFAGMWSSIDGTEVGLLVDDGTFLSWNGEGRETGVVSLDLKSDASIQMLMAFSQDWILVRNSWTEYDVFDRLSGDPVASFEVPDHPWIRFDRGGTIGVAWGFTTTLSLVDPSDWSVEPFTADLGDGTARGVAVSPTGDRVAIGGQDGFLRIFETDSARLLESIQIPSPTASYWIDDMHLAVGNGEGLWTVLTLDAEELVALARQEVLRGFTPNECALYRIESCSDGS